ncbi:MAG: UDP-N-acetylmuramate--L-alanine ligase [Clostridiaceae bacterium]|nr:UDP-N-acetylmuramate--L-alanine ligase [Clostridiaceae bacterium]
MTTFDILHLTKGAKVHFIAIGGISMSGLAEILLKQGVSVSGSDIKASKLTQKLEKMGAEIHIGHDKNNVRDPDLVVYSAAIKPDNPEILAAKEKNIPIIDRATLLGGIMLGFNKSICVSGTHGKTTTTSMIAQILMEAGVDPTVSLGGELDAIGGNIRTGNSEYFLCEACEYCGSFLKFSPLVNVILNIEEDHLDYFKDINHIKETFKDYALKTRPGGVIVANFDDENVKSALCGIQRDIYTFGFCENCDFYAKNIKFNAFGNATFDVFEKGKKLFEVTLKVPGQHNVLNALAAVSACKFLGISDADILKGLSVFAGTHRRFEIKGSVKGAKIIDDYAHHPTEIEATLNAVKKIPHKRRFLVFQPHTYTRTLALFDEFVKVFENEEHVIICDIYSAREADNHLVSSKDLAEKIPNGMYLATFSECAKYLWDNIGEGDVVLTIGAGDVYEVGEILLKYECALHK